MEKVKNAEASNAHEALLFFEEHAKGRLQYSVESIDCMRNRADGLLKMGLAGGSAALVFSVGLLQQAGGFSGLAFVMLLLSVHIFAICAYVFAQCVRAADTYTYWRDAQKIVPDIHANPHKVLECCLVSVRVETIEEAQRKLSAMQATSNKIATCLQRTILATLAIPVWVVPAVFCVSLR
jgi:hypothetical protein